MKNVFLLLAIAIGILACSENEQIETSIKELGYFPHEDFFNAKYYPETNFDHISYFKRIEEEKTKSISRSLDGVWEDQGPGNLGGLVNKIVIDPVDENVIYLGFTRGGLYKTIDGGSTWKSVFNEFTYLAISHIEIDPNDNNVIYIGTGDENISGYPAIGNGVFKSMDGGETWTHMGLGKAAIISHLHISKTNSDIVYASGMGIPFEKTEDRGVYKSTDGGESWEQVLMINDSTGVIAMVVAPDNPDIVYAAGWNRLRNNKISKIAGPDARIHKSTDGGTTWTVLENGLPEGDFVRIGLQMYGDDGNIVFASYSRNGEESRCSNTAANFYGLYKSSDGGDSWIEIPTDEETTGLPCDFQGGFAWYFGNFAVNSQDENDIILLGVNSYRTKDNGESWENFTAWQPHVDHHDVVYRNGNVFLGTDGGAYKHNEENGWQDIENISANLFYRIGYNPHRPDLYYGGLQDNGTVGGSGLDISNWVKYFGGDGFQIRFNADDPNVFYVETQNGNILRTEDGGADYVSFTSGLTGSRNWDMQYILSPHDQDILYTGTDRLWVRRSSKDLSWSPISGDLTDQENDPLSFREHNITCLSQSKINPDILYAGTSDGWVWSTENSIDFNNVSEGLPRNWISEVKASPTFERTVFVTVTGFKSNDFVPHIFRSDNLGQDWVDISGDLPNFAINDLYILEGYDDQYIFAATEIGVYVTENGGNTWDRLGNDFPFIQCFDLEYNPVAHQIMIGTHGKGLRTYDLEQLINVGTEDLNRVDLVNIYPNVSSTEIMIGTKINTMNFSYKLVNSSGQIKNIEAVNNSIDISGLAPGIHYLLISDGKSQETKRFVKI